MNYKNPIQYGRTDSGPFVQYLSPGRKFGNLREELNNDVMSINKNHGPVYLAFSSGIDSQVMLRCWLDMKGDMYPFFLHNKGYNDFELDKVRESEKFYGIKIDIYEFDLGARREEFEKRMSEDGFPTITHYPFEWVSKQLPEPFPIIMSGANEPAILTLTSDNPRIYHNLSEGLLLRFNLIKKIRPIFDFPYSAESLAAYYTDDNIKTFIDTADYFKNNLGYMYKVTPRSVPNLSYFNYYVKSFVKGRHFKKDIIWTPKKTGYELFPEWTVPNWGQPAEDRVSVPYHDLVDHLESCNGQWKQYGK
jgi:hypothetical protein